MPKQKKRGPSPKVKEPVKNHKTAKRIGLGIFFVVGTAIIVSAIMLLVNISRAVNVKTAELSENLEGFLNIYNEYNSLRDLPSGVVVSRADLVYYGDKYSVEIELMNTGKGSVQAELQAFYSEEFLKLKPTENPFIRYTLDDEFFINKGETKSISVTAPLSTKVSMEELKEVSSYVYLEMIVNAEAGRIMLPLTFVDSSGI